MTERLHVLYCLVVLLLLDLSVAASAGAAGLTIDPPSVTADYTGAITFTITGLSNGDSVLLEKFVDTDGNMQVDAGEPLTQSVPLTDGAAFSVAGVRDTNVPGDDDGATNGQVRTTLKFQAQSERNRAVGTFAYRVSSTSAGFTPVTAPFTVMQPAFDQRVTGTVTSGTTAVPNGFVLLLNALRNVVARANTNANGEFTLNAPAGSYVLIAAATGFVFDAASAPNVELGVGATVMQDLSMIAAERTISGRVTEMSSNSGIAGVQLTGLSDEGMIALMFTDAGGQFSGPVSAGHWALQPSEEDAVLLGYLLPSSDSQRIDTTGGSVAGVSIQWLRATALIHGTLKDGQANPLPGLQVSATAAVGQFRGAGSSDESGNYVIGVVGGSWTVLPTGPPGAIVQAATVTVASGEAARVDFIFQLCTAHLRGRAIDELAAPLANFRMHACVTNQAMTCVDTTTNADGTFDVCVPGGTWNLLLDMNSLTTNMLIGSTITTTVADGGEQNGLMLVARHATERISGSVTDLRTGAPIDGIQVRATTSISGADYEVVVATNVSGDFSLAVSDGTWQVGLACDGLMARDYSCPMDQVAMVPPTARVDFTPEPLHPPCAGDCNGDSSVTVDEVLALVNFALENADPTDCTAGDINNDHLITIDEILAAVNRALTSCTG